MVQEFPTISLDFTKIITVTVFMFMCQLPDCHMNLSIYGSGKY